MITDEQIHKAKLHKYFGEYRCVCGQPKRRNRWCCLECREAPEVVEQNELVKVACAAHIAAVDKLLALCTP